MSEPNAPLTQSVASDMRMFGGVRFSSAARAEMLSELAATRLEFSSSINAAAGIRQALWSTLAALLTRENSKEFVLVVDEKEINGETIAHVVLSLTKKGYRLSDGPVQGAFATKELILPLATGQLTSKALSQTHEIVSNPEKNSLFQTFVEIVKWAYINNADDIDFVLDLLSHESRVCFKIGSKYIQPARRVMPTETVAQLLGIAWQANQGSGSVATFDPSIESQCRIPIAFRLPQSKQLVSLNLRWAGMAIDKGCVVTLRLQRMGDAIQIKSVQDAGYQPHYLRTFTRVVHSEGGAVIVAGTVGSGKSTTLASLVKALPPEKKVCSIEDPVELEIPNCYQKTIARNLTDTGVDVHMLSATRAIFRSALDALYLGEIRDPQTGAVCRQVAQSGHTVFSTAHASSALGIIDRLASEDIGISRSVLATPGFLKLLIFQRLVPVNCEHCAIAPAQHLATLSLDKAAEHDQYFARLLRLYGVPTSSYRLRNPAGCEHCKKADLPELNGYRGRTVAAEVVELDDQMLTYILAHDNVALRRYWRSLAAKDIMDTDMTGRTAMESAVQKAAAGLIDPREIEACFESFETVELSQNQRNRRPTVALAAA